MKDFKGIVVHCSDSPQGRGDNAETIDRWHRERGWSEIGYNYVILEDGIVEEGRSLDKFGAHAKGYNDYIGICLIGIDSFTEEQFISLAQLIIGLLEQFQLDTDTIKGHYEVSTYKTCPNFDVNEFKKEYILGGN